MRSTPLVVAAFAAVVAAKTDIAGCTTSNTVDPYGAASVLYYVPGSCEICELLDCGGGRAPPKTTVPGCPLYTGTASYTPSYLTNCGGQSASSSSSASIVTGPGPVVISTTASSSSSSGSSSSGSSSSSPSVTVTPTPVAPITTVSNGTTAIISTGPGPVVISTSTLTNGTSGGNGGQSTGSGSGSTTQPLGSSSNGAGMVIAQGFLAAAAGVAALVL